jgi:phosphoglycerate dehydrogenase-like enzyme
VTFEGVHEPVEHPGRVLVLGATEETPPPGLGQIATVVDVTYADNVEQVAAGLPGSDVVFAWRPRSGLLEPAWEHASDVTWIQSASAGVDGLLFPALIDSHVVVTNARGIFDEPIAEYVLALMLVFAKGFLGMLERQREHRWEHRDTETLSGRHVLVVGVGSIGRAIGRRCKDQGMVVRGVGNTSRGGDDVFLGVSGTEELSSAVAWADYVVNVLPNTSGTRSMFDASAFGAMRPHARFVNVGRGSTVDEAALTEALAEGRIAGAALDVFQDEPLPDASPLWDLPNVIVSPHMSGDFAGWREALVELFVDNLRRYLAGEPLLNVVDKERGYVPS